MWLQRVVATIIGSLLAMGLALAAPASAVASPVTGDHTRIVNANPADYTPEVQDGDIKSIVKVGDRIFVGGSFTTVKEVGGAKPILTRNRLFAFDAATGAIDPNWAPNVDRDEVSVILPAADGQSVYVGGGFNQINGVRAFKLARLDLATGQVLPNFAPQLDARVKDLRLVGGRLYVGGFFTQVGGVARPAFATLNPDSGAVDGFSSLAFSGNQPNDTSITNVYKMDVSPDGSKLVAVGNFNAVNGQPKRQIVMIDLTGAQATLANWDTVRYADQCSASFDTYMRDIDFSSDGSYFVVTTTGAYFSGRMCDTQARWESATTGAGKQPTWVNTTGGDTTYAVEVTPAAVYVGGHFRWANNPFSGDRANQGAVARDGIAALDPVNGLPFSWNPGRTRGVGVFDMLATPEGLWIGSDTNEVGGEFHPKLALFPLAGGVAVPANLTGTLPGDVYSAGGITGIIPPNYLRHRSFNGTTAGNPVEHSTLGIDWRTVRGAFMVNGELFYGNSSDGKLFRRTFDGASIGAPTEINTGDLLVNMTTWHGNVKVINGMFFSGGRIYYTRGGTGSNALYYRYFTPESNVVGAQELVTPVTGVTGVNWSNVGGMFTSGDKLYFVNNADTGKLYSLTFTSGVPSGSPALVSSADWRGRAVFLYTGAPNAQPAASFTSDCTQLACTFNAAGSSDPDGSIASFAWDFGDGATDTAASPSHTYSTDGAFTVTLTVTDNRGAQATTTRSIVLGANQTVVGFRANAGFNGNVASATVTAPSSVQEGDALLLVLAQNNTTTTVTAPAGWTRVDGQSVNGATSTLYRKVAVAGDAGQAVTFGLSAITKVDLSLVAYSGTATTDPIASVGKGSDASTVTDHTSPTAPVASTGSWGVTFWGDKSSTTTAWTAPAGVQARSTTIGVGSGRITSLVVDSGSPVPTGTYGGLVAQTDAASRAMAWTVVLARADAPNGQPTASFTSTCTFLTCTLDAAASSDPDGTISSYAWDFGDGATGTGVRPSHPYADAGTYTIGLTVTDNRGATATTTRSVTVAPGETAFHGTVGFNGNVTSASVIVPAEVQTGDTMLLVLTQNSTTTIVTPPAGWTQVDNQSSNGAVSTLYRRTAAAGEAGQRATFGLSVVTKVDLRLVAYSGTSGTEPIAAVAKGVDATTVTAHPSPTASVAGPGSWAVTFWADKSSTTTAWTAPDGVQNRATAIGAGSGRITSLVVDSGAAVPAGSYGGLVAQTDAASRAFSWTVVLNRAT